MIEAIVIIVASWWPGTDPVVLGHRQQKRQIELLDSTWAELASRNSMVEEGESGATLSYCLRSSETVVHH